MESKSPPHSSRLIIDNDAIAANFRDLARRVAPATCGAVIKADGYGLGAANVAPALLHAGCRSFFVIATTTGQLGVSSDAGATWSLNPTRIGPAEALHARRGSDGGLEIDVVADSKVLRTLDGGTTTENLLP